MADLLETSSFPEGVYRIETTDPVVGGEDGIANKAAKQLAARTRWLKDQLAALLASLSADYALKAGDYSTLRARATTKVDVGLGNVPNFASTDDASSGSSTLLATAKAVKDFVTARLAGAAVTAGAGLSGGGALDGSPSLGLAPPGTLSGATANAATAGGHTHAVASTASRGDGSTATLLQAKAMADHVAAGDHAIATTAAAGFMSAADKAKLDGVQAGAQVNAPTNLSAARDAAAVYVASSTGADATLPAAGGGLAGVMSWADKAKLDSVQAGAEVNQPTNLSVLYETYRVRIDSSTGQDVWIDAADSETAGVMRASEHVKLAGIQSGANVWPGVYGGSSASALDYPVGTCLLVSAGAAVQRNAAVVVRIGDATGSFEAGGSGAILTGTWRARGYSGPDDLFVQRVA